MADSNITKRALASALKGLMQEVPLEKISVGQICERCDMNRKSFYYHFQDKYDLVNWIFDTEFLEVIMAAQYAHEWEALERLFRYFDDNRDFYRKALRLTGRNSLAEHFRELMLPALEKDLQEILGTENVSRFEVDFFADAFLCAILRWMRSSEHIPCDELVSKLKACVYKTAAHVAGDTSQ